MNDISARKKKIFISFFVDKINSCFSWAPLCWTTYVYIKSKDKCRIILFVFKHRTVIKNNGKDQPIDIFHRFDVGDDNLHNRNRCE